MGAYRVADCIGIRHLLGSRYINMVQAVEMAPIYFLDVLVHTKEEIMREGEEEVVSSRYNTNQ